MADVNLKCEKLKDQLGQHGQGPINVYRYVENSDGTVNLMFRFRYISVQGPIPEGNEFLKQ